MNSKTINSFSARTVGRLMSARRAVLTMLATFLIAMTAHTAWADSAFSGGSGSSEDPYKISSPTDLNQLATDVNSGTGYEGVFFIVTQDITYEYTSDWNNSDSHENNFTAIGNQLNYFQGHFNGNGKTIRGIRIYSDFIDKGLFGFIRYPAVVENVTLADTRITGGDNSGCIVGVNEGGTIEKCHVTNTVKINAYKAYNSVPVCYLGGIVGYNYKYSIADKIGTVSNCISEATLSSCLTGIGGIAGRNNEGKLSGNFVVGATIPAATDNHKSYGAIAGQNDSGTLTNNYYSRCTVAGTPNATGVGVGADANDQPIGDVTENNGAIVDEWGLKDGADGSEAKPFIITTTTGLDLLAQSVNAENTYEGKYFKLGDNIAYDKDKENNFTPIGYRIIEENSPIECPFRGHFDGNGKTISGININNSDVDDHGIFGYLYGTVKNLVVSNCSIVADHNIGAIVGVSFGTIENCHVGSDVTLSGHSHVGGIAGWCATATIKGCTSAATITGTNSSGDNANNLGGIVGATNGPSSSLTDNLFTGAITGDLGQYIGAIFGWGNEYATLTNNVYTSAGFGGIGAEGSATGADGAGARKAVVIGAAEGVTITPTGEATTYNVSGITTYADNNVLGYDSKLYAGATDAVKLSIVNTGTPETGYEFSGFTAGEGVTITSSENVYTLTVPASDVTVDVVYDPILYTITYKGVEDEGVTFTEDNPEAYTVETESFALNNPSREGYLFTGWTYEGQDEPTKTVTIAMGSTGDKTFTANWEEFVETEVETAVTNEAAKEVEITKVMVPKGETKAVIPATVNGYTVTNIAKGAFYYKTGEDHVQDIILPDTKRLINIEEDALIFDKLMEPTLHVPLGLLSDYANMPGLKIFFEADKIQAMAVAVDKYWTFSCGIDVKVPEGVKVYTCRMNDDKTAVVIHELTDDELGGVIKANNGVLLSSATGEYPFVVNHASATEVGKSYENNLLEPVLRAKNYASGEYYVLKDNEFHPILANDSKVPACKAVLKKPTGVSGSRTIGIDEDDDATRIWGVSVADEDAVWYTVSGQRIDKPTKKGLYIKNGKKVIIK